MDTIEFFVVVDEDGCFAVGADRVDAEIRHADSRIARAVATRAIRVRLNVELPTTPTVVGKVPARAGKVELITRG